jgi:hypothetical protein
VTRPNRKVDGTPLLDGTGHHRGVTSAAAVEVSWPQVHAFRLERHHLLERAPKRQLARVAGEICGAQAQVMSAAELQLAARATCSVGDVRRALWTDRTLVKTWLMRGTLHLMPAADLPLFTAALSTKWMGPRPSWLKWFHMDQAEWDELAESIGRVLGSEPMTRDEVVTRLSKGRSKRVAQYLRGGWGSLLKPAAFRGLLCFGPSRGTSVTFVRPRKWLNAWRAVDPDEALVEVARRYLRAYGPATKQDFARWFAPSFGGAATAAWSGIANELTKVSVDGTPMQMLTKEVKALIAARAVRSVQLLPGFDPYLMGHSSRDHLFERVHRWKVSRVAGWISPVVLVDGRVEGTWTHARSADALVVTVVPLDRLPRRARGAIEVRVAEMAAALGLARAQVLLGGQAIRSTTGASPQRRSSR